MKVTRRDTMPNGIKIQLEDWHEHNTAEFPDLYGYTIGAYPTARNAGTHGFVRPGERFRLDISVNSYTGYGDAEVLADYEALISGQKSLEDLAAHFWNGDKDRWYLGMIAPDTDEWYEAYSKYGPGWKER